MGLYGKPPPARPGIAELRRQIAGHEGAILAALGIDPSPAGSTTHRRCPMPDHEDVHPSWRWGGSSWYCSCTPQGSIFDLVMRMQGCNYIEAVKYCAEVTGILEATRSRPNLPKSAPAIVTAQHRPFAGSQAEQLWKASRPLSGVAVKYLEARGCATPPADGDLRFLPLCYHPFDKAEYPALVALVTDAVTGEPMSVHRTFLAADGAGKAPVDQPRLMVKGLPIAGGVVRLWPSEAVSSRLTIAEGIETALTAALAITPAWACLNKNNLATFPLLEGIEDLLIVADHDEDGGGQRAAETTGRRWADEGREVRVWTSERAGADLNDEVTA